MYPIYSDIRDRLGEPDWHDKNGVPRYGDYKPGQQGIYDDWDALFVVECQSCNERFSCAGSTSSPSLGVTARRPFDFDKRHDAQYMIEWFIGWGDAPWHGESQCAGTTMSTSIINVKEIWHKNQWQWKLIDLSSLDLSRVVDDHDVYVWEEPSQ